MAVIDGTPRPIALGNIAPLRTGMQLPEDAIQDPPVLVPRMPDRPAWREMGRKNRKLLIGQFVASHHAAASFIQDYWSMCSRCETTKPDCRTEPKSFVERRPSLNTRK